MAATLGSLALRRGPAPSKAGQFAPARAAHLHGLPRARQSAALRPADAGAPTAARGGRWEQRRHFSRSVLPRAYQGKGDGKGKGGAPPEAVGGFDEDAFGAADGASAAEAPAPKQTQQPGRGKRGGFDQGSFSGNWQDEADPTRSEAPRPHWLPPDVLSHIPGVDDNDPSVLFSDDIVPAHLGKPARAALGQAPRRA